MDGILDEVAVPSRPNDATIRFRQYRGTSDLAGMAAANQAMRDAEGIVETTSAEDMAIQYANLTNCDVDHDLVIVERIGEPSRTVGYARVEWRDLTDGSRSFQSLVIMAPEARTPGLARALLGWAEARTVDNARQQPDRDRVAARMQTWSLGADQTIPDALDATGWRREGRGYEMLREPLDDIPALPVPDGLEVRPIVDDEGGRRAVWIASVDAFRDHRDEPEASEEDWRQFRDESKHDTGLWVVAFDGDEIAGGALGLIDEELIAHHGTRRGYIDAVFTRPAWRRRGLARAALAEALVRLRNRGMTSAFLEVDGLNPNQAMGLYGSLGFSVVSSGIDWVKPLPDGDHGQDPKT